MKNLEGLINLINQYGEECFKSGELSAKTNGILFWEKVSQAEKRKKSLSKVVAYAEDLVVDLVYNHPALSPSSYEIKALNDESN